MRKCFVIVALLAFFCVPSLAEAGPLRRLAGIVRGGKAAVGKILPPYRGRAGGCSGGKLFGRR